VPRVLSKELGRLSLPRPETLPTMLDSSCVCVCVRLCVCVRMCVCAVFLREFSHTHINFKSRCVLGTSTHQAYLRGHAVHVTGHILKSVNDFHSKLRHLQP
jgi:hypothetical protein